MPMMRSTIDRTMTAVSIASPGYAMAINDSAMEIAPIPIRNTRSHLGELTDCPVFSILVVYQAACI